MRSDMSVKVWTDKSVTRVTVLASRGSANRVMPNSDPRDRFVCPYLTIIIMKDSFSCTLFCANAELISNLPLKYTAHLRQPFCFDVIF